MAVVLQSVSAILSRNAVLLMVLVLSTVALIGSQLEWVSTATSNHQQTPPSRIINSAPDATTLDAKDDTTFATRPTMQQQTTQLRVDPSSFASSWIREGVLAPIGGPSNPIDNGRVSKEFKFHVYDVPDKYIRGALELLRVRWPESGCNRGCVKTNYTMLDWRHAHSLFTADVFMTRFLRFHPSHTSNPDEADVFIIPMMTHLYNCAGVMEYMIEILSWVIREKTVYYKRLDHRDHFLFWWRWGMHFGSTKKFLKRLAAHFPNINFISFDYLELQGRNQFQEFSLSLKPNFLRARDWIVVPYPDLSPQLAVPIPITRLHDSRPIFFYFSGTSTIGGIRRWIKRECVKHQNLCVYREFAKHVIDDGRLGVPVSYPDEMKKSTFCGHAAGDALSSRRPTSAILAGCIPVLICDLCLYAWENFIDYSTIAVFVHEDDVINGRLFEILQLVPEQRIRALQRNIAQVRERFRYNSSGPPAKGDALDTLVDELALRGSLYRQYRRWYRMNPQLSSDSKDYPVEPPIRKRYLRAGVSSPQEERDFNNIHAPKPHCGVTPSPTGAPAD